MDREDFIILGMDLLKKAWLVAIKTAADNTHFIGKDSVRSVMQGAFKILMTHEVMQFA